MTRYTSIAVSGSPGSGKSTLSRELSKIYKYPVFSLGALWRDEWKRSYPDGEVSFEEYWGNTTKEDNLQMDKQARKRFEEGGIIGDLRYTKCCEGLPVFKIFLTASLEVRGRVRGKSGSKIEKYNGRTVEEIIEILTMREEKEVERGRELYGSYYDYRDSSHYDLILDSGLLTLDNQLNKVTTHVLPWKAA